MRTEEEIKEKIAAMQRGKGNAKYNGDDAGYRAWLKAEKVLKWVLEK